MTRPTAGNTESLVKDGRCKNTKGNEQKTNMQYTLLASFSLSSVEPWLLRRVSKRGVWVGAKIGWIGWERFYEDEPGWNFWDGGRFVLGGSKLRKAPTATQ